MQIISEVRAIMHAITDARINNFGIHPIQSLLSLLLTAEEDIIRNVFSGRVVELLKVPLLVIMNLSVM